ncbi:hypothetical protein DL96DRAFT_1821709 [Flagelloscypha sp. PMI_526]|nr:hypothetical protein DL96DRAFT_1821709 [Flagelloscypha sp. PMI_526]
MPHPELPTEILNIIAQLVSSTGGTQDLQALALSSRPFVPLVQSILFQRITFNKTRARPGGFLTLLKARPNLALLVKSVILTQSAMEQKALIKVFRLLHNVERLEFPAGRSSVHESTPIFPYLSHPKWSWLRLDPSMAASLATVGRYLRRLRVLVLRDVEELPLDIILEHLPHLLNLELVWTKSPAIAVDPSHKLKSLQWHLDEHSFKNWRTPEPTWLLGSSLTHVHFVIKTTLYFQMRHQPSCRLLTSLCSLTFEVHHWHFHDNVGENSTPFFLNAITTLPDSAPLHTLTLKFRTLGYNPGSRHDWDRIEDAVTKLGTCAVRRPTPVRQINVQMHGFTDHHDSMRDALAVTVRGVSTDVSVESFTNGCL